MKAVGHAWKVAAKHNCADGDRCPMHGYWFGGYRYNYGLEPPHYPVPAIRIKVLWSSMRKRPVVTTDPWFIDNVSEYPTTTYPTTT